ncbi:MAG: AI-2E family transporter [Planctomycetota bacterium]|nr:AI-2E family transporter [Planctomycetota bacterium]
MRELLDHPWVRLLLIATTVAMCSFAIRETASVTLPIVDAVVDVAVPLAIGFVIAYILTPLVDLISRRVGFARWLAASALFTAASLLVIGSAIVLVPLLFKQGAELANQLVRGEPFADLNGDGQRNEGEPYTDLNRNGLYDPAVLARLSAWAQEQRGQLKRMTHLAVDDSGLALLAVYVAEIEPARARFQALLTGPLPPHAPPQAPTSWNPAWPAPAAAAQAALAARPELAPHLYAAAEEWFAAHQRVVQALRAHRGLAIDADPGLVQRLRAAVSSRLDAERRTALQAELQELERAERGGAASAHELLNELRGGDMLLGGEAMAEGLARIVSAISDAVERFPQRLAEWAEQAFANVGVFAGVLLDLILIPIYAFFLILAMPVIRSEIKALIPAAHRDDTLRIIREIERAVAAFFRGRLIICLICSLVGVLGFLLLQLFGYGVPYGIFFGVLLGLVTPIPLAGIVVIVPALALVLLQPDAGALHLVLVLLVYGAVQATEAVLIPLVLGREVELHPVWLIIALLLCGKLMGVLGLILAVPIAATVRILGREYLWPRMKAWAARGMAAVQPPRPPPP